MAGRRQTINLPMPEGNLEEVFVNVMKVTKEHEVIDINGFKIKRRKTEAGLGAAAAAPQAALLQTPHEQAERGSAASQRTPNVEEYEISAELYERLSRGLRALSETSTPEERLLAVCEAVCGAGVETMAKEKGTDLAATLETVFKSFLDSLSAAAQQGSIQFAAAPGAGVELGPADLKVDLEARKAGLRNRLQLLKDEENEWHDLLARVEDLEVGLSAEAEPVGEDQEEGGPGAQYAAKEIAAVRALGAGLHRELTMQVDGLCTLVGDMEDLIDNAKERATEAQAQHHDRLFQPFSHVNSPARLIKGIIGGPPSPPAN